ncbi:RNA dependent RNA polymerase-domain-containing protein [Mycena sp. CBHHK59/15]|nr:RNA dependent RNA polymerase-domain-containing protein [Mycena sp. CBHHK59/15]
MNANEGGYPVTWSFLVNSVLTRNEHVSAGGNSPTLLPSSAENRTCPTDCGPKAVHRSRATRLVGDSTRFMTVAFTKQIRETNLRKWLQDITEPGKSITYDEHEYVFLGFTENNLKSGHLLFFREGPVFSVSKLKEHFGSYLQAVYEVFGYSKYAARLGLSFSSTVAMQELEEKHLLQDLKANDGSLTTAGCGLIHDSFAQDISARLGVPFDTAVFQMRLGGIKGTLTHCPDELLQDLRMSRQKIAYRRSMVKYNNGPHVLEKSGRLNKQFIMTTDGQKAFDCIDGEVVAEVYKMLLAGHDMNEPYLASQLPRFQNISRDALRKKLDISVKVGLVAVMRNPGFDPDDSHIVSVFAASGVRCKPDRMGVSTLFSSTHRSYPNTGHLRAAPQLKAIAIGGRTQTIARTPSLRHKDMRTAVHFGMQFI